MIMVGNMFEQIPMVVAKVCLFERNICFQMFNFHINLTFSPGIIETYKPICYQVLDAYSLLNAGHSCDFLWSIATFFPHFGRVYLEDLHVIFQSS